MKQEETALVWQRNRQEEEANEYTLRGMLYTIATLAVMWILTVVGFFEVDREMLSFVFICSILLMMIPRLLSCFFELDRPWMKYLFLGIVCVVSSFIASIFSYHAVLIYVLPLLFAIQYRERKVLIITFCINCVLMGISTVVAFYYGICDLNILVESTHNYAWYLQELAEGMENIRYNDNPLFIIIWYATLPRSIILLLFTVMLQTITTRGRKDAVRMAEMRWKSETDLTTRLFNKNKYQEMVKRYYPRVSKVAVIYWDVNNLKSVNDKYGHSEGDRMLSTVAAVLLEQSGETRLVYRMGGDEFLMVIDRPAENEAAEIVKTVEQKLAEKSRNEFTEPITSAAGWAEGKGCDILRVVDDADANMYRDKREGKRNEK